MSPVLVNTGWGRDLQYLAERDGELKNYLNWECYPCKERDSTFLCQKLNWEG